MPQVIPFTNDGCRTIDVALGENMFRFRTYYLPYIRRWIMDIMDQNNNPIVVGICLNVGVDNLVKGKAKIFEGQTLRCVSIDGTENDTPNSLGNSCFVLYYPVGEKPPIMWKDKMLES